MGVGERESGLDLIDRVKYTLHLLLRKTGKWCGFNNKGKALFCWFFSFFKICLLIKNGRRVGLMTSLPEATEVQRACFCSFFTSSLHVIT